MKICKNCGCEYEIGNAFHKLCWKCNKLRLSNKKNSHNNKEVFDINVGYREPIQIRKGKKSVKVIDNTYIDNKHPIINPYNVDNESELFVIIWRLRPHICSNSDCKKPLGDEMRAHYFSHIYAKSIRPWLRLDPNNIELLCIECHNEHDFGKRKHKLV